MPPPTLLLNTLCPRNMVGNLKAARALVSALGSNDVLLVNVLGGGGGGERERERERERGERERERERERRYGRRLTLEL